MTTGSFFNNMYGAAKNPEPTVGMGATILMWTDRHACTIVEVSKGGKRIGVQRDKATRSDGNGMSDAQEYTYEPDTDNVIRYFTLRKSGAWVHEGDTMRGGEKIAIGFRREYHDFSF